MRGRIAWLRWLHDAKADRIRPGRSFCPELIARSEGCAKGKQPPSWILNLTSETMFTTIHCCNEMLYLLS